jgi:hypothetical protein
VDLFKDILPNILQERNPLLTTDEDFRAYLPHLVNRALSYHLDCIMFVNEMNRYHFLSNQMQYDFYFYALRKYKRQYSKWPKKIEKNERHIEAIMRALNCSRSKAEDTFPLLSDETLVKLHEEQGG